MDTNFYLIISFISLIQSIAGVGILVLGTPIFLISNYTILETMFLLLPISIISSFSNLIILHLTVKLKDKIDLKIFKYFFIFCCPCICLGLIIVNKFNDTINFSVLVSIIIFFSIILKIRYYKILSNLNNLYKKLITLFIGLIHGLTNSGGTLLSLFLLSKNNKNIHKSRFQTHLFYLLLASIQFSFLNFINNNELPIKHDYPYIICVIIASTILGNKLAKNYDNIISILIYILALITSFALFIKGIY